MPTHVRRVFPVGKTWKHPKCPLIEEWISEDKSTMEYLKKGRKCCHITTTQMNLEDFLSETSPSQTNAV